MSIDLALPETERKLREARFFLNYMRGEEQKSIRLEPEANGFCLSAFLSAGRSVTFVLQKEIGGEDHYRPLVRQMDVEPQRGRAQTVEVHQRPARSRSSHGRE